MGFYMMNDTIAGVDLAKDVIQVCVYSNQKVRSNTEMTPPNFIEWLANNKPMRIVFEACGTSNYWKRKSTELGHDAQLISIYSPRPKMSYFSPNHQMGNN